MGFAGVVCIVLVVSVAFGFLFDIVCTGIEKMIYKKPDDIAPYVEKYSDEFGVPENLIYAVIKTESNFDSSAESSAGAVGLMQLSSITFDEITNYRLKEGLDIGMRYDPETNIRYGTYYLSHLFAIYGNWDTALAAYNAGLGNVDKWLKDPKLGDSETSTLKNIPFTETRNYVKKVNRALSKYDEFYN